MKGSTLSFLTRSPIATSRVSIASRRCLPRWWSTPFWFNETKSSCFSSACWFQPVPSLMRLLTVGLAPFSVTETSLPETRTRFSMSVSCTRLIEVLLTDMKVEARSLYQIFASSSVL